MSGYDPTEFPAWEQVLDEIAASGYSGTELGDWGFLPTDPEVLKKALSSRGLAMIGALVPVRLADAESHRRGQEAGIRTALLLAALKPAEGPAPFVILTDSNGTDATRTMNAGRIKPEHGLSPENWTTFAHGTAEIARAVLDETGVRTVFHHHCAGYIETPEETARLLEMTPPELVGLCFDTGHWAYAGGDPLDGLRRFRDRISHVHFKDCHDAVARQAREDGWDYFQALEHRIYFGLGTGDVGFPALIEELRGSGYRGWIVVEDELPPGAGDPFAAARSDRQYLTGLGL
jgi:inosose dehydratase